MLPAGRWRYGLVTLLALSGWPVVGALSEREGDPITIVRAGLPHDALFDVAFSNGEGIAVGNHGAVLRSVDGGITWEPTETLADLALTGVALGKDRTIVVGQQGAIFVAVDGGEFQSVDSGTAERLLSVAVDDEGLGVAVGGFGTVLISEDGGLSWRQVVLDWTEFQEEGLEAHLYDAAIADSGEVFVVGEFGLILRSKDRGASWEALAKGDASLFSLHLGENGLGFAVGQEGVVLKSTDGGNQWTGIDVGTEANLLDVWASPEGEVVVVGMRVLLRSSDMGANWTRASGRSVERSWYQALAAGVAVATEKNTSIRSERVYAVGQTGNVVTVNR